MIIFSLFLRARSFRVYSRDTTSDCFALTVLYHALVSRHTIPSENDSLDSDISHPAERSQSILAKTFKHCLWDIHLCKARELDRGGHKELNYW